MTTTERRVQQVVLPEAVARKMFPADSKWLLPNEMPSITWLAGWVKCDQDSCYGGWVGMQPGDSTEHCEHCNGLGYPPIVEIVSDQTLVIGAELNHRLLRTVHGRLALGAPVAVVDSSKSRDIPDNCFDMRTTLGPNLTRLRLCGFVVDTHVLHTVACTLVPGGVAYPVKPE